MEAAKSDVHSVLLVPNDIELLCEGPCGSKPPTLVRGGTTRRDEEDGRWLLEAEATWTTPVPGPRGHSGTPLRALVLAWNGEPLPEGMDKLARELSRSARGWDWEKSHLGAIGMARLAAEMDVGTIVFLDELGKEILKERIDGHARKH